MQRIMSSEQIVIFVDNRERNGEIIDFLKNKNVNVKILRLNVGDYIISDRACIERKTFDDFINSIINGRVFQQVRDIREFFDKPILIIEGNGNNYRIRENALKAAISTIVLKFDASVLMSKDEVDTARLIYWLAKKEQEEFKREIGLKGKKKPKELKKIQEHIISSFPGISNVISKRILKKFKSIRNFVNTSETELMKVRGIGNKQAKRLYEIVNKEYEVDE